ncbi:hypothetical protein ACWCP6_18945 [Streptomyces sp. NPDC002004]
MTSDAWAPTMRQQIGLGRLLPLGGPEDGAWITEVAVGGVLRRAASGVLGIRLGGLRVRLDDPEAAPEPSVPAPRTALPPGPLRIETEFSAPARQPLTDSADQLRQALLTAAHERLGLVTAGIDLHVTDLMEDPTPMAVEDPATTADAAAERPTPITGAGTAESEDTALGPLHPTPGQAPVRKPTALLANTAAAVPGVTRLAPASGLPLPHTRGRPAHPVRIKDSDDPPGRHVQIELATAEAHRALDVALAVRAAVAAEAMADAPGPVTVAVLVTAVDPANG